MYPATWVSDQGIIKYQGVGGDPAQLSGGRGGGGGDRDCQTPVSLPRGTRCDPWQPL